MLFVKDDLRIRSASYAIVPWIDLENPEGRLELLEHVQAFVAYAYAAPHEIFGDPFLSSEHASIVILSPGPVSIFSVRPEHHVDPVGAAQGGLTPDARHEIPGYAGLYNFCHHFWVARGSRIYGPMPRLTLNISQDLEVDLGGPTGVPGIDLLALAIAAPLTEISNRVLTAVRWLNKANAQANDETTAIVMLAIAFEALLGFPSQDRRTERFVDAIALLLGRVPRLDSWAQQFYETRSQIVHEGRARQLSFVATELRKPPSDAALYQPLLAYGREIFRLCVGTLLTGAELARRAGLEERLVTNQQRFERICALLSTSGGGSEKLLRVAPLVRAVERFRFVFETGLQPQTVLGAARAAAEALLEGDPTIEAPLRAALQQLAGAKRTGDHYEELEAVRAVSELLPEWSGLYSPESVAAEENQVRANASALIAVVWRYGSRHYYWIRQQREAAARAAEEVATTSPSASAGDSTALS